MAKKYLLYIHDSRFEQEKKKSELVNKLLAVHYDKNTYLMDDLSKMNTLLPPIIKTKKEAIMSVPQDNWKPCKHGADPKFCRFAKPGKPCK